MKLSTREIIEESRGPFVVKRNMLDFYSSLGKDKEQILLEHKKTGNTATLFADFRDEAVYFHVFSHSKMHAVNHELEQLLTSVKKRYEEKVECDKTMRLRMLTGDFHIEMEINDKPKEPERPLSLVQCISKGIGWDMVFVLCMPLLLCCMLCFVVPLHPLFIAAGYLIAMSAMMGSNKYLRRKVNATILEYTYFHPKVEK